MTNKIQNQTLEEYYKENQNDIENAFDEFWETKVMECPYEDVIYVTTRREEFFWEFVDERKFKEEKKELA